MDTLPTTRADALASGSKHYFTGIACRRGHIGKRYTCDKSCTVCSLESGRAWRKANPEKAAQIDATARALNLDAYKERVKSYHLRNRVIIGERKRAVRQGNLDHFRERDRVAARKMISTPQGKIANAISTGVHRGIKRGSKASRSTFDLLGYTVEDLIAHLEARFSSGMTWENYGRKGWHVDHVIPRSAFNYETPDDLDFQRCWALENLQPLWEPENFSKGAKMTASFQPSLLIAAPTKRVA